MSEGVAPSAPSGATPAAPTRGNFRAQVASAIAATPATSTTAAPAGPSATTQQPASVTPIRSSTAAVQPPAAPEGSTPGWSAEMQALDRKVAEQLAAESQGATQPGEQQTSEGAPLLEGAEQQSMTADAPMIAGMPEADFLQTMRGCLTQDGNGFMLPKELQDRMFVTVTHDGQQVVVPMSEGARGIVRQNVLTRKEQELAGQRRELESAKQNLRAFFQGWDDPTGAGLLQSLETAGVAHVARAGLRAQWGSPEQPNVEGFLTDLQNTGYWGAFIHAAKLYAQQYEERVSGFMAGTSNLPAEERARRRQHAKQMVDSLDHNDVQTLLLQMRTREEGEKLKREQAKQLREQQLRAAQQQQQQGADPAVMQQLAGLQERAMAHFGIKRNAVSDHYFGQFLVAEMNNAQASGMHVDPMELMARAAEATRDQLAEDRAAIGGGNGGTAQQQVAAAARPQAHLPARPSAAPAAGGGPAPGALPQRGGNADFKKRIGMIQNAYKQR